MAASLSAGGNRPLTALLDDIGIDETYFLESAKGDRSLKQRRKLRKRGSNKGRWGLGAEQRPVLTAVARGGETLGWALPSAQALPVGITIQAMTGDAIVVSDIHPSYRAACKALERVREVLNRSPGARTRVQRHLNTLNNRHSAMKRVMNHWHRGVATKILDNYMHWLSR